VFSVNLESEHRLRIYVFQHNMTVSSWFNAESSIQDQYFICFYCVESFWFDRNFAYFLLWKLTNFDKWKCVSLLWEMNSHNHCFSLPKVYIHGWYSWFFPCVFQYYLSDWVVNISFHLVCHISPRSPRFTLKPKQSLGNNS
jgi:hypothetical protein